MEGQQANKPRSPEPSIYRVSVSLDSSPLSHTFYVKAWEEADAKKTAEASFLMELSNRLKSKVEEVEVTEGSEV